MSDVLSYLPHRYPFLMVDRVVSIDKKEKQIIALKNITFNEPQFQGHFPDNPIFPGIYIIESLLQTSGILVGHIHENTPKIKHVLSLDKVKFYTPVVPGDQLILEVTMVVKLLGAYRCVGKAYVDNEVVAEGNWTLVNPQ